LVGGPLPILIRWARIDVARIERLEDRDVAAAKISGVMPMTALRMITRDDLKGRQLCCSAPG
jgi:hypothetical protein